MFLKNIIAKQALKPCLGALQQRPSFVPLTPARVYDCSPSF